MRRPEPILFLQPPRANRSPNSPQQNQPKYDPVIPEEMNLRHHSRSLRNQYSPAFSPIPFSSCGGWLRGSPARNGRAENAFPAPVVIIWWMLIGMTLSRRNQFPSPVVQEAAVHLSGPSSPFFFGVTRANELHHIYCIFFRLYNNGAHLILLAPRFLNLRVELKPVS